ncbi:hypothetical protein HIM_04806 [Hirsutella minnesotensis 3608]|uniref:Protein YTP1-like C-terminal domain-containing protein n=1 Tax=Hirsutella minnesotensis 3608 TaxID=1043627 RepID=A0A0F8A5N7_9HYPO|nr:hypothetical protein HIM_04806 [Hirsutella minnesotensis 3608]
MKLMLHFRLGAAGLSALLAQQVIAHGGTHNAGVSHISGMASNATMLANKPYPPTYFSHPEHRHLIYAHIFLIVIAWVMVLPVAVMLSIAKSRFTLGSQYAFLAVNTLGLVFGALYGAETPNLYPNHAHGKVAWIASAVFAVQAVIGSVRKAAQAATQRSSKSFAETLAFIPSSANPVDGGYRSSSDSGQGTEPNTDSLRSHSDTALYDIGDQHEGHPSAASLDKEYGHEDDHESSENGFPSCHVSDSFSTHAARIFSTASWKYFDLFYKVIDRIILPLGFLALTTGIVTFGRFFEGKAIFSGLAHWIKGGVFFWLGLFTLGRWSGSFAELGWAWNMRPQRRQLKWRPSAEFVESALIFIYGSTNIFLEHLGNWGSSWSAQDLEHMAITVLFIGGGACGMLVESSRVRDLLNTSTMAEVPVNDDLSNEERHEQVVPTTYAFSLNPIPALVILLLGIMMSSHQQATMISSMVHKQWGNLLLGASFARGLTYVLMYLRPPTSVLPSRPPTELLASFGLIAGGIIFMASSSDTIEGMIHYNLDAMFMYTITMGLVGLLMAWEVIVLAIKGWAIRKERRLRSRNSWRSTEMRM